MVRHGGDVAAVVTRRRAVSEFNSDHVDMAPCADAAGVPVEYVDSINAPEAVERIRGFRPDVLCVFGWSELLKDEVLAIPAMGTIGAHPALLPQNRGRHPLIWAVQLGLPASGLTFFWMDRRADSGDILAQADFPLQPDETATSLYARIKEAASQLIPQFLPCLADGTAPRVPQERARATYWRRRSRDDGRIDFRMSGNAIDRLVRALAPPYPGAHVSLPGRDVTIWRVRVMPLPETLRNAEFGRVLAVDGREVHVRADDAIVALVEHELDPLPVPGTYL